LLGKLLTGLSLREAIRAAGDFVAAAVRLSAASGMPTREGILLESCLVQLFSGPTTWKSSEDIDHA
jgi:hypothetical protein